MRLKLLLATLCAASLGVAVGWYAGRRAPERTVPPQPEQPPGRQPIASSVEVAPLPRLRPAPAKVIPLSDVYATVGQEGMKLISESHVIKKEYEELYQALAQLGTPLIFAVRGQTVHAAVEETEKVFTRKGLTKVLSNRGEKSVEPFWAFVFLGRGSNTPYWLVHEPSRTADGVSVSYSKEFHVAGYGRSWIHAYWISLGDLPPGPFTLRLHNTDEKVDTLIFRTRITNDP